MDVQIVVNGRVRMVRVEPHGGAYAVTIDGETRIVDAAAVDPMTYSLICTGAARESLQAGLAETGIPGELAVHMASGVATVRVQRGSGQAQARGDRPAEAHGRVTVYAPMPGRVVRVLVHPGDDVADRQGLLVVEAMKMENELRAPRAGRVLEVLVTSGQTVETGRPVVVIA